MVVLIIFGIVAVFLIVKALTKSSAGFSAGTSYDTVVNTGVAARGLILSASRTTTSSRQGYRRFQMRQVVLDIEIPGQAPYVVSINLAIPRGVGSFGGALVSALPGDTLELSVDPRNPNNISVVGPGGFTGPWLSAVAGYNVNNAVWPY